MHKNKRTVGIENIPVTKPADPTTIPMLDEDYERSVVNLLPPQTAKWFKRVPEEWLHMDEKQLKMTLYPEEFGEAPEEGRAKSDTFNVDQKLRYGFWAEYDSAQTNNRKMIPRHVWMNIVHCSNWYNCILPNARRLAWIMCPPGSYISKTTELHFLGLDALDQIFRQDLVKPDGTFDVKLADVKVKAFKEIDQRVRGAIPIKMKVDSRTLNVQVDGTPKDAENPLLDPAALEKQLQDLREKLDKVNMNLTASKEEDARAIEAPKDDIIDVSPSENGHHNKAKT